MVHTQPSQPLVSMLSYRRHAGGARFIHSMLLRFPQIIAFEINQLHEAFARAIAEGGSPRAIRGVSPSRSINDGKLWPKSCAPVVL